MAGFQGRSLSRYERHPGYTSAGQTLSKSEPAPLARILREGSSMISHVVKHPSSHLLPVDRWPRLDESRLVAGAMLS